MSRQLASYRALVPPLLIGHRGLSSVAPENTLAAIEAAADLGVAGVEIDVRTCRTGELVVFHDVDLGRMTRGKDQRRIADLDLADVRAIDLGGGAIPTLGEVLELCRQRRLFLNVEMKRDVPRRREVVMLTANALRDHDPSCAIVVSTFDPAMLLGFRALAPDVPTALLVAQRRAFVEKLAPAIRVSAVHPDKRLVDELMVKRHQKSHRRVMTWTVNDVDEARRLLAAGVDGIMTDDPALLAPLFRGNR